MGLLVNGHSVRIFGVSFVFRPDGVVDNRVQLETSVSGTGIPMVVTFQSEEMSDLVTVHAKVKTILESHGFTVEDV